MSGLDVICIGAINYDYMFHCTAEDLIMKEESKDGDEQLSNPISDVENDIYELIKKFNYLTVQPALQDAGQFHAYHSRRRLR